ncbi:AraC family transcriptional regulator [Defluviimonas sp. WL0050]|uniref:AraC family transcriptional regulator n=1 Tax=Albidovulum litorale TaxID=2984134 RepID=A0ABT2ZSR5_9RHOB|nr:MULTISPECIES: AraC family transcriptional regulator [Defluviimonas]MCV2874200.1 AraC family transcriptional regulator [Defluviimonas sp. WL0050]MDI3336329.1 helix-turn-helix domain-containing protein [Defluviimonas aestuarii]
MSKKSGPRFTRGMLILSPFAKAFTSRGGDIEAILARNGIPVGALTDPAMLVDASACYSAMEDMAETLGDPYFGAKVAIEVARKGTPAFRDSATHALNLGDFLSRLVVEVSKQVDNVWYSVSIKPGIVTFDIHRTVKVIKRSTQLDAVGVALYVTLIKKGIGETFNPKDILITVPTTQGLLPGFLPKHALVTSQIDGMRISFPTHWLWAPFSLDWELVKVSRGEFAADGASEATLSYLRGMLMDNIAYQDLTLNNFSSICSMHPRRIQRILWAHGTSYSQMKDDVRQSVTEDLLSNTTLPVAQIALQVGLSGPAALDRAFRRWTGRTPTQFRADSKPKQG